MAWEDDVVGPDVAFAGLHISERIGKDVTAQLDLEEALEASRYASHPYSSLPKEWPPAVEVAETRELPPVLIEKYNSSGGEGTALCGIFPEIRRAWASVDNSLFLWRFDKWDAQCPEYSADEQAICAVGLAKTKPGIFVEAIQYLLVFATPFELILIGVCCTASGDGSDPYAEIALQPLPEYRIPSDGVTMTCISCTDKGRIFLAGRDGHIYEMQYSTGSVWQKRCRKLCLTSGLGSLLSRWILPNAFKFGAVDPITDMVVDNERHMIYARTEAMKIQAFDLGEDGEGTLTKIAEQRNLIDPREAQYGGRRSTGLRGPARGAKPVIISVAPLSTIESKGIHLVAVLSDGRRMYLSTSSGGSKSTIGGPLQRPSCLKVIATSPSPPLGIGGGLNYGAMSASGRTQPEDLSLKVEAAFYSAGTLVLSDSSTSTMSSLLVVNRDSSLQSSLPGNYGVSSRNVRALREIVSSLPIEGRMLCAADILPLPDIAVTVQSLFSDAEAFAGLCESSEKASGKLWARGDLPTQHILPRRRVVVFSSMGLMEMVFNRPVDILRRLFETNAPHSQLEEFFNRFGRGEAAAMCLMLAADLVFVEGNPLSTMISEKAAEAFEDPGLVGLPQIAGSSGLTNARSPSGGFSMGQVVQEAEPVFSGAHEGLCLCSSRLLFPIWELPVMVVHGKEGRLEDGIILCRLSAEAMKILESKIRSLEQFLRSRRNKRRGLYGYVAGLGDYSGSILYGVGNQITGRNLFGAQTRNAETGDGGATSKRQRLAYTSAELAAMEVRAMECLRRLLRRSSEALFLLQLICHHNVTRLIQSLDNSARQKLVQLTFNQLVCSEEGDQLAIRLIASLMEYYVGPDGRGTVDEISEKLREGCPSYYNESDYKYFLAVECLEKASASMNTHEREILAKDAFNHLTKNPESAELRTICKRFADLRFYEAVVRLPLQKAQALDAKDHAFNMTIDQGRHANTLVLREQCYDIIIDALRSLKGVGQNGKIREFGASSNLNAGHSLDQASRDVYIRQIIQLSVQWPDTTFHEYLYRALIELGLENELLEYGGSDLVPFLQSAGRNPLGEVQAVNAVKSTAPHAGDARMPITSSQVKYLYLLAKYYVLKQQHLLAARVLYTLAERQCTDAEEVPTLNQRLQYLSSAIIQAKSASSTIGFVSSSGTIDDDGLLDMLEAKLAILHFQIRIKEQLELIASKVQRMPSSSEAHPDDHLPRSNLDDVSRNAGEKAKELSLELKSITQLYNDFAIPFKLWEICLEMLNFANYSGDVDSKIVREIWYRILDQALSRGGVAEACSMVKRVGSTLYPGDGDCLPLETICLHLEKAALERLTSGVELVGDEDVARSLLAACKGAPEPVLSTYDQLLSNGAILVSGHLRLRLLRSVLVILREWSMSVLAHKLGTTSTGASSLPLQAKATPNQGVLNKITSSVNRYMTELRRLALPQNQTEPVYRGFVELEEHLVSSSSFRPLLTL